MLRLETNRVKSYGMVLVTCTQLYHGSVECVHTPWSHEDKFVFIVTDRGLVGVGKRILDREVRVLHTYKYLFFKVTFSRRFSLKGKSRKEVTHFKCDKRKCDVVDGRLFMHDWWWYTKQRSEISLDMVPVHGTTLCVDDHGSYIYHLNDSVFFTSIYSSGTLLWSTRRYRGLKPTEVAITVKGKKAEALVTFVNYLGEARKILFSLANGHWDPVKYCDLRYLLGYRFAAVYDEENKRIDYVHVTRANMHRFGLPPFYKI